MDGSSFDRVARTMASAATRRGSIAGIIGLAFGLSAGDDASARRRRRRRCIGAGRSCGTPGEAGQCCQGLWCYGGPVELGGARCLSCGEIGSYCDNDLNYCCVSNSYGPISCVSGQCYQ